MSANLKDRFTEDYFERGRVKGISGYMNYSWMPEQTLRMAHYMITDLPISRQQKVLDFGCAKGYLVKALNLLDVDCDGVDISQYAIENVDTEIKHKCWHIDTVISPKALKRHYEWMVAKDVFEHIEEDALRDILERLKKNVERIFAIVPLAKDDKSNEFVVPDYHNDVTHITIEDFDWWCGFLADCGWTIEKSSYKFSGMKENWTDVWARGNGFFVISSC